MNPFQRILFPVDLSEQSKRAVPFVKAMAERFQSEVTLLYVMELPMMMYSPPEATMWSVVASQEQMGKQHRRQSEFETFLQQEFCPGRVEREFLEGEPANEILAYAHSQKVGLVMMPTHGYSPFRRFLLGSITAKVLHDAECPVWTGVHTSELRGHDPKHLKRILCAVETLEKDVHVIQWAAQLGSVVDAEVILIHAVPHNAEGHAKAFDEARRRIEELQAEAETKLEITLRGGKPAESAARRGAGRKSRFAGDWTGAACAGTAAQR